MKFIGDFHIHSHYSLATSKELNPEFLDYWARIKGIKVVGTGDFTHPKWVKELEEKLIPAEEGLFKLKKELRKELDFIDSNYSDNDTRFVLSAEISCIYKKNGVVRKVHNIILAPDFETVKKIQEKLLKNNFNISSDGRPIIGMDSKNLLELCLEASDSIFFIPAHIWTPWFSVLGDKSGFNTIEECYEDLSNHIYAVEMGLSSDPPMNWSVSFLDKLTLMANSDAHSPEKLGRNANIFNTGLSYKEITNVLKTGNPKKFLGTINFFPQEGKYHYDGHRKCNICWDPIDTVKNKYVCPVCGSKIIVGVLNRVAQLSDREDIMERKIRHPFYSVIPLKEIIAELINKKETTKQVATIYNSLLKQGGSEFNILLNLSLEELDKFGFPDLALAIERMRKREVFIREGFDGEYGKIKIKNGDEIPKPLKLIGFDVKEFQKIKKDIPLDLKLDKKTKNKQDNSQLKLF